MDTLAQRLKIARQELGISQAEAARRVGIKQPTLSSLESGESKTSVHITKFAAVYGVSALWLGEGKGPKTASPSDIEASVQVDLSRKHEVPTSAQVLKALQAVIGVAGPTLLSLSDTELQALERSVMQALRSAAGDRPVASAESWEKPEWMRGPVPAAEGYQEAVLIEDDGRPLITNMKEAEAATERERKKRGAKKSA